MSSYHPQYKLQQNTYPIPMTNTSLTQSRYSFVKTPQVMAPTCTYPSGMVVKSVIPVVTANVVPAPRVSNKPIIRCTPEQVSTSRDTVVEKSVDQVPKGQINPNKNSEQKQKFPLANYLKLPRQMFPPPRMFPLDPNVIINEFCKLNNIQDITPWILDLEFGIPRAPVTRPIPVYDVQYNSIHCKNTPGAIHPGFEGCNSDFKRELLFYYDCITSTWYKGYMTITHDPCTKNFQAWLQPPMQTFGMCWT